MIKKTVNILMVIVLVTSLFGGLAVAQDQNSDASATNSNITKKLEQKQEQNSPEQDRENKKRREDQNRETAKDREEIQKEIEKKEQEIQKLKQKIQELKQEKRELQNKLSELNKTNSSNTTESPMNEDNKKIGPNPSDEARKNTPDNFPQASEDTQGGFFDQLFKWVNGRNSK